MSNMTITRANAIIACFDFKFKNVDRSFRIIWMLFNTAHTNPNPIPTMPIGLPTIPRGKNKPHVYNAIMDAYATHTMAITPETFCMMAKVLILLLRLLICFNGYQWLGLYIQIT
jgi:hypothetical protein